MFQLELLDLLKQYNQEQNEENKLSILKNIKELSSKNPNKLHQMKINGTLDTNSIEIITKSLNLKEEENSNLNENSDDIEKIKQSYIIWVQNFRENQNRTNQVCNKLVEDIILFYAPNRFEVIEKILNIKNTLEFENFKNHIKNNLRVYFSEILKTYKNSEKFEKLNFIKKYKKKKEIIHILENLANYKFNLNEIKEVTKNEF